MDKPIQYAQVMSNFNSAYNNTPNVIHHPTIYRPISSSSSFPSFSPAESYPKFNFDLYKPNEYHSESLDYASLSPASSVIIHHHPVYSPSPSPPSQTISKLRQINDELCYTLAQCDLATQTQRQPSLVPSSPPAHHHVYHYPISRSRSPSEQDSSSSIDSEPIIPKKHNARITYKAHIPRRETPLSKVDQLLLSTSDAYTQNEPTTVDFYPTRDQGYVKNIRNRPDNQSPWLADTSPERRNSYSEMSTYRTPRGPDYENKLLQPPSRLADGKVRPRSASVTSRIRPDSAPNPLRQSAIPFSRTAPAWRPSGTIKRPKFMGSNAPPSAPKRQPHEPPWNPTGAPKKTKNFRAFDPVSKPLPPKEPEPVWNPSSKKFRDKPTRYFEPTLKPELTAPIPRETKPLQRKKNQTSMSSGNPELKTRIAQAQSKVKTAWNAPTDIKPTKPSPTPPTLPRPTKKPTPAATTTTTTTTTVKPVIPVKKPVVPVRKSIPAAPVSGGTDRSSLKDAMTKPMFQSTPRNQSIVNDADDLFEEESQMTEPTQKPVIPHQPPQVEITPTKTSHTPVPEPDKGTKATVKNGVLIHGSDIDNRTPSSARSEVNDDEDDQANQTPPIATKRKTPSPKPAHRDDVSVIDDEQLENDTNADAEQNSVINQSVDHAAKAEDNITPRTSPKLGTKTPPRPTEPSPKPTTQTHDDDDDVSVHDSDEGNSVRNPNNVSRGDRASPSPDIPKGTSNRSPVATTRNNQKLPSTPPPPTTTAVHDEADDFFD